MKKRILFALMFLTILLTACNNTNSVDDNLPPITTDEISVETTTLEITNISDNTDPNIYTELFNLNNSISIKIDISDEELSKIQKDYEHYLSLGSKSPIYRIAKTVIITINDNNYVIEDVGIRMKGNTSRRDLYDYNGNLNITHFRLSFSQTFDNVDYYGDSARVWDSAEERNERKNRTFATLECLELKWNKNYDQTHICEYYAYSIFRDYNVLAPQVNLTTFSISDIYCGIYNIYEPVDKIFIERNLPKEDWGGDLYKVGWTNMPANYKKTVSYGVEDEDSALFYNYDLKTNKSKSTHKSLVNLLSVINSTDVTPDDFSGVVDTEYWAKFAAVSYFTGNPDDMRNNYNNHYVYFLQSSGKAIFIPYDYDRTMGVIVDWNPSGSGMSEVSPYSDIAEGNRSSQSNPLYILSAKYLFEEYTKVLVEISKSKWMTFDYFKEIYNIAKENYDSLTVPDNRLSGMIRDGFGFTLDGGNNMTVSKYMENILKTLNDSMLEN